MNLIHPSLRPRLSLRECSVKIIALVLFSLLGQSHGLCDGRQDQLLSDGWKFIKDDVAVDAPTGPWESVNIPHTWNTKSADASGDRKNDPHYKSGYYRGACWYARSLDIPADWKGKRVFILFEAASLVSKAYLNGQLLGEHRGGVTAFCYELTPVLHYGAANDLRIQVDNSHQEDVPPLSGDFNIDGGLYRPVHLIVTDPVCITPLDMASPGVFETIKSLGSSEAQVEVKALISNGGAHTLTQIKTEIKDADGKVVATQTQPTSILVGQTGTVITNLAIPSPHLWNARKDPYLYTTTVSVLNNGNVVDFIVQPLGLRSVEITEDKGFLLNGQPYPIRGVNKHQDWGDQGWATTTANYDEDAQIILDMGTTAIRLAHYPQSEYFHHLCDQNGLLLWNEVSLVNETRDSPEFAANAEQQLRELILQRYNHPSATFWGLFNELGNAKTDTEPTTKLLQHLKSVILELDSSRLIVAATDRQGKSYNYVPDHLCFNTYPGWYSNNVTDMDPAIDKHREEIHQRVGISEYGAGANTAQHQEGPLTKPQANRGPFHPEEWQTWVHENDWANIQDNASLWGTFIWCMFDFQSDGRREGSQPDLNDKGLVTQDRSIKKDAYFFYQANWSDKPMVYIASRRMVQRKQPTTEVKVFSNCDQVELSVNGTSLGTAQPNNVKTFRWPNVALQPGKNQIAATGTSSQGKVTDSCEWELGN